MILLIGFSFQRLQAQDFYSLSGKVTDSIGTPLYPSTVRIITDQDTMNTLTHENGSFVFKTLLARKFRLLITMKGYQSIDRAIAVPDNQRAIQLAALTLRTDYSDLDPVTVTRVRPVTINGDTVSYHVAAFPTPDGSEVEDILKRLPGMEVDMDGNVIINGKPLGKILVDGKEFFGGDVLLAIRNLPADVVDKLQVIDDYGDKARLTGVKSGEPAKVLNIVLKADKRNGEFGRVEVSAGEKGKYLDNIFANAFKGEQQVSATGSLSNNNPAGDDPGYNGRINYANKWNNHLDVAIDGSIAGQSPHSTSSSLQQNFYSGEQLQQTQNNQNSSRNNNSSTSIQLNYKPDNYSSLRLTASGGLNHSTNQATGKFTNLQQDSGFTKSSTGQTQNTSQSTGQNLNSNLYYERLFPHSRRRFDIQVNFSVDNSRQGSNSLSTATVRTDSTSSSSLLHYLVRNNVQNNNFNFNTNWFFPLGTTSFLELGYREQSNFSRNNVLTQQPDSVTAYPITIDSLSQDMVLRSFTHNIHVGYIGKPHRLDLSVNIDAQPGQLRGTAGAKGDITSYAYFSLLPILQAAWDFMKGRKLNLSYNGQPNLPSLQQLAPYTNLTNPQYPITGNPNLKHSYNHNIALHFEQSAVPAARFFEYGLGIGYSATQNTIIQNLTTPKDSSQVIQATTYLNAATTSNLHADYHLTLPAFVNKHLRITLAGDLSRNQTITMTDSLQYPTQTWTWNQRLHLQLIISNVIETALEGSYSITHTVFATSGNLPGYIKSATIALNSRHYLFKYWLLNYRFTQSYTSNGDRLKAAPTSLTASLQHQFLPHNKGVITLTGYNLFDQSTGVSQSASPTGFSQTNSILTGRYFLVSLTLKLNHFHK